MPLMIYGTILDRYQYNSYRLERANITFLFPFFNRKLCKPLLELSELGRPVPTPSSSITFDG